MTGHMQSLQRSLTSSVEAYNKAVGSLRVPRAGLGPQVPRARRRGRRIGGDRRARPDRGGAAPPPGGRDGRRRGRAARSASQTILALPDGGATTGTGPEAVRPEPSPAAGGAWRQPALAGRTPPTYSARDAPRPPIRAGRRARGDAGRAGRRAPRRPHDTRGGLGPHPRHRAVADPAPVRAPGCRARAGRTACAPTSTSRSRALVGERRAGAGGGHRSRRATPGSPQRAVWPLLEVVEEHFDEPWLAPLAQHIRNSETVEGSKRFSSIRHVADLFDRYAVHRPDMLQRWAAGLPRSGRGPLAGRAVAAAAGPHRTASPAERLVDACRRLRDEPDLLDLPPRLSLFGLTRLPASYLDVLEAIGCGPRRPPLPAAPVTGAVGPAGEPGRADVALPLRSRRPDRRRAAASRSWQSWGRDAREMQLVLGRGRPARRAIVDRSARPEARDTLAADPGRRPGRPRAGRGRRRRC